MRDLVCRYAPVLTAVAAVMVLLSLQVALAADATDHGPSWANIAVGTLSLLATVVGSFATGWARALSTRITAAELAANSAKDMFNALQLKVITDQQPVATTLALINQSLTDLNKNYGELKDDMDNMRERLDELYMSSRDDE